MHISLIAALADNRVIGHNNRLPWHLPADLQWFKQQTLNKPVIMGRKTWDSLPIRPLPGRLNLVLSRHRDRPLKTPKGQRIPPEQALLVPSIEQALTLLQAENTAELMCIGGAHLYQQLITDAQRLYLTRVHHAFTGDAFFPEVDKQQWQEVFCEHHLKDESNPYDYSFCIYERS